MLAHFTALVLVSAGAVAPTLPPAPSDPVVSDVPPVLPQGRLGQSEAIASTRLGYAVNIRVYEPPPTGTCERLPVLYVTDGSDYWKPELGDVVPTLDRLIASGRMAPVIAVFIDAWDDVLRKNRRFEQFLPAGTALIAAGPDGRSRLWSAGGILVSFATDALLVVAAGAARALVC